MFPRVFEFFFCGQQWERDTGGEQGNSKHPACAASPMAGGALVAGRAGGRWQWGGITRCRGPVAAAPAPPPPPRAAWHNNIEKSTAPEIVADLTGLCRCTLGKLAPMWLRCTRAKLARAYAHVACKYNLHLRCPRYPKVSPRWAARCARARRHPRARCVSRAPSTSYKSTRADHHQVEWGASRRYSSNVGVASPTLRHWGPLC